MCVTGSQVRVVPFVGQAVGQSLLGSNAEAAGLRRPRGLEDVCKPQLVQAAKFTINCGRQSTLNMTEKHRTREYRVCRRQ